MKTFINGVKNFVVDVVKFTVNVTVSLAALVATAPVIGVTSIIGGVVEAVISPRLFNKLMGLVLIGVGVAFLQLSAAVGCGGWVIAAAICGGYTFAKNVINPLILRKKETVSIKMEMGAAFA